MQYCVCSNTLYHQLYMKSYCVFILFVNLKKSYWSVISALEYQNFMWSFYISITYVPITQTDTIISTSWDCGPITFLICESQHLQHVPRIKAFKVINNIRHFFTSDSSLYLAAILRIFFLFQLDYENDRMLLIPHAKFGFILLLILFLALVIFVVARFRLNRFIGISFVGMYVLFLLYAFLQELYCIRHLDAYC